MQQLCITQGLFVGQCNSCASQKGHLSAKAAPADAVGQMLPHAHEAAAAGMHTPCALLEQHQALAAVRESLACNTTLVVGVLTTNSLTGSELMKQWLVLTSARILALTRLLGHALKYGSPVLDFKPYMGRSGHLGSLACWPDHQ